MRDIKLKYFYKNSVGNVISRVFDLDDGIANGDHWDYISDDPIMRDYKIIDRVQYTGLKDKGGVDIYEGDIVSLWYAPRATAKGRIKFENGGFYFKTTQAEPNICLVGDCVYKHHNEFTVIGNLYENPELLDGGTKL